MNRVTKDGQNWNANETADFFSVEVRVEEN